MNHKCDICAEAIKIGEGYSPLIGVRGICIPSNLHSEKIKQFKTIELCKRCWQFVNIVWILEKNK